MFDMTDVAMADRLAGDHRSDLDDVILGTERVQVRPELHDPIPSGMPLLDYLVGRTEEHETVSVFKKFYANDDGSDWQDVADHIQKLRQQATVEGPWAVTRMYLEYGADLYGRCPHLSMKDVWLHLCELGFPHSKWAVYRYFNRNGISTAQRSRAASDTGGVR